MSVAAPTTWAAGGGVPSGDTQNVSPAITSTPFKAALQKIYSTIPRASTSRIGEPTVEAFRTWALANGTIEPDTDLGRFGSLVSFDEFAKFILGPKNNPIKPVDWSKKDLTKPLQDYFISSSHNTYLTGHQLYGESTVEGYVNTLRRGCRCIEIDVWDGDDGEPSVFHGYTLTKEITFKEVVKAIGKHAFRPEEGIIGPVIISLECHAGISQQKKCVEIMAKYWGDMLVHKPIFEGEKEIEDVKKLPSPLELQGKILVKSKYRAADPVTTTVADTVVPQVEDDTSSSSDSELEEEARKANKKKPKKHKVIRDLAKLGVYCSAHHFQGFHHESAKIPNHVYSFSERSYLPHVDPSPLPAYIHNINHLTRIYPFGLRFSSNNADPTPYWRLGCQLVALNWQKIDDGMMLNEALFSGEGGYVLKPETYRLPLAVNSLPSNQTFDLSIEVIACQNIPLPRGDSKEKGFKPYFKFELHVDTVPAMQDRPKKQLKAKTKSRRTCNPEEYNETITFQGIKAAVCPNGDLGFLRCRIFDEEFGKDSLAGWFAVRFSRLKQGYGAFRVIDTEGVETKGLVLCNVQYRIY